MGGSLKQQKMLHMYLKENKNCTIPNFAKIHSFIFDFCPGLKQSWVISALLHHQAVSHPAPPQFLSFVGNKHTKYFERSLQIQIWINTKSYST